MLGAQLPKAGQLGVAPQQTAPQSDRGALGWVPRDVPSPRALPRGEGRVSPCSGEEGSWALEGCKWPFWGARGARTHSPQSCRGRSSGKEQLRGTGGGGGGAATAGTGHSPFSIHCEDLIPEINSTKSTFIKQSPSSKLKTR